MFIKNIYKTAFAKIFLIFASFNIILRLIFLIWQKNDIDFVNFNILKAGFIGLFFDFITFCYISLAFLLIYISASNKLFYSKIWQKINKVSYFIFLYIIIFSCFAEIIFWQEFQTRFNFIAVDYLVYTTEVINNIVESYPIFWLLGLIFLLALGVFYFTQDNIFVKQEKRILQKIKASFAIFVISFVAFFTIDSTKISTISDNNYLNEIAQNGIYQLFSAYRNNKINFTQLYRTIDEKTALKLITEDIAKRENGAKFINEEEISRYIEKTYKGEDKRYNIIFVTIESLSADFMNYAGNATNITPNLDDLAKKGLFFTNLKATGTRTVRGLEALTLSVPPTPGNSIVRRANNENLFNITTPFKDRKYDVRFLYGGYGYFDNMNYFYENNGFEIVDRAKFAKSEISFENAWGVSDEDLFDKTIKEADKSFLEGKNFFNYVMTTSNHRPFTYPDGKIDINSKTGRNGAVKYTDYAIGQLIKKAKEKKWFDNTIFVFVSDHCAGSAGNTDVPLWRYQIPAIFYAPKIIQPMIVDKNISQIDIAPTLIGLFNFSYKSKFFGSDILRNYKNFQERAFVSTYIDVGFYKNNQLFLLKPKKETKIFDVKIEKFGWNGSKETVTNNYQLEELDLANAYYQGASYFFEKGKMKNFNH